jgi:hypothetical protein
MERPEIRVDDHPSRLSLSDCEQSSMDQEGFTVPKIDV